MSHRPADLLLDDIREAIGKIEKYVAGYDQDTFISDEKSIDAVVRNLEIIGEAANRIPDDYKSKHENIDWRGVVGLRHRIVHEYFGVDANIIWQIIQVDLPDFKEDLAKIDFSS